MPSMNRIAITGLLVVFSAVPLVAAQGNVVNPKPGVTAVQAPFAALRPSATFKIGRTADWVLVTDNAIWVTGTRPYSLQRIDPATNTIFAKVRLSGEACAGLAFGFGSVWVPICGNKPLLDRVDSQTNRITAVLSIATAGPEAGVTASSDSVWMVTDKDGTTLSRIDPATNTVRQRTVIPEGSYNPLSSGNAIWITGFHKNILTAVDAVSGEVLASIPVGPKPRFLTSGGGSIWTLNQGDGSVTRVAMDSRKVTGSVDLGIPGPGGDLAYGAGFVWASTMGLPITVIEGETNRLRRQWVGRGGDALRFGYESIWLTDYHRGLLWRIPFPLTQQP